VIPKEKYLSCEEFEYVTLDLFKEYHSAEEEKIFLKWMRGQTCGLVDNAIAIYIWDYERWLRQGRKTDQGYDWD